MSDAPVRHVDLQAFAADPYPILAQLRAEAPIAFVPELGATLLTWVLTRVDLPAVGDSLRRLTPRDLVPVLLIAVVQLPLRPWRWAVSFPASHPVGFRACFETLAIWDSPAAPNIST